MKARAAMVGRRLSLGTWRQLEAWGRWLSGETHAERSGLVRLGVILRRFTVSVLGALFYAQLLQRVPGAIYAVPVVWAIGAWQMSDSSATPPPGGLTPLDGEEAGQTLADGTTLARQKGMLIYSTPDPDNPVRTHVRVVTADETHA
ncbi:hypothetical protein [Streptomyces flaveolus]|uniref:Integral membrane protein n=1 Tax=Streptomyces flaveolus TaxID=67297 RepID=A0ABV3A7W6_9ACTN